MNKAGLSWKRAVGITKVKSNISRSIGIPLTKGGRQQKVGRIATKGCSVLLLTFILVPVTLFIILFF